MIQIRKSGVHRIIEDKDLCYWKNLGFEIVKDEVKEIVEEYINKSKEPIDEKLTVSELKAMCKERGIKGYSRLNEAELIALLNQ